MITYKQLLLGVIVVALIIGVAYATIASKLSESEISHEPAPSPIEDEVALSENPRGVSNDRVRIDDIDEEDDDGEEDDDRTTASPTRAQMHTYAFDVGNRIQTIATVNVRMNPDGTIHGAQVYNSLGTVTSGPIDAGGYTWWKIDYDSGFDGWSADAYLKRSTGTTQAAPAPTTTTPTPTPTPTPAPTTPTGYTLRDVATHASASSCWTIIEDSVYDLTSFVSKHPGGEKNILKICGRDGTAMFESQHGGDARPERVLPQYRLGAYIK